MNGEADMSDGPIAAGEWIDERVPVAPGGTLFIHLDRGQIEVTSHDEDCVRITASCRGWASGMCFFTLEREGNDVELDGDVDGWIPRLLGGARVQVRAWIPRRYALEAQTRGGAVRAAGIGGRCALQTGGGAIELQRIDGPALLRTSGGSIRAEEVNGDLRAHTSGGRIEVAWVNGDVEAHTSGGRIEIEGVAGQVDARTSGGRVEVSFADEPGGRIETSGGPIEVLIPEEFGADLDARTSGGRVRVEPPLEAELQRPNHVVGSLNGGGLPLRLRTSGGQIRVRSA